MFFPLPKKYAYFPHLANMKISDFRAYTVPEILDFQQVDSIDQLFDGFCVKRDMEIPVEEEANYKKTDKGILYVP